MPGKKSGNIHHYDVVFLGDSLAGRLASALLTKKGCRVLVIHDDKELPTPWLTSSLLFDKILDFLDGRSCNTTPLPYQVITRNHRVDFNGKNSLADELRREIPESSDEVITFLEDMKALGENLEELLWEHQGLPSRGLGNRLRFRKNCFRADIPGRVFRQSLRDRISQFKDPAARKILTALFSGFSFTPSNRLTLGECALIWSGLGRQSGVFRNGLEELLWHRFKQFHGEEEELHRLARVRTSKDGSGKFLMDDDRVMTADHIVFSDRATIPLCEGLTAPPVSRQTRSHLSSDLSNRISPLLARNLIVDGNPPLKLSVEESDTVARCRVENAVIGERGLSTIDQINSRLQKIFPFVDLALVQEGNDSASDVTIRSDSHS